MPQLRTEDVSVLGLKSKFQNVFAYTNTYTFIHSKPNTKEILRPNHEKGTYVAAVQINFQEVGSTQSSKQPWIRDGNTKNELFI